MEPSLLWKCCTTGRSVTTITCQTIKKSVLGIAPVSLEQSVGFTQILDLQLPLLLEYMLRDVWRYQSFQQCQGVRYRLELIELTGVLESSGPCALIKV